MFCRMYSSNLIKIDWVIILLVLKLTTRFWSIFFQNLNSNSTCNLLSLSYTNNNTTLSRLPQQFDGKICLLWFFDSYEINQSVKYIKLKTDSVDRNLININEKKNNIKKKNTHCGFVDSLPILFFFYFTEFHLQLFATKLLI